MSIFKAHFFLIVFINMFSVISCTKEGEKGDPGPESLTGTLIGYINLFDEDQNPLSDNSGAKVKIWDSSMTKELTTDAEGKFQIDGLETGRYYFSATKDSFSLSKGTINFLGGKVPTYIYNYSLYHCTSTTISDIQIYTRNDSTFIAGKVTPAPSIVDPGYGMVYLSINPDVTYKNYQYRFILWNISDEYFEFYLTYSRFDPPIPPTGINLYGRAYGMAYSTGWSGSYIDEETNILIFNVNPQPSELFEFTMPYLF